MSSRFRFANPPAGDFELPDVESVLDALEAAVVTPDTPMFDAARQSWQPVGRHPEVRAGLAGRARFLPPGPPGAGLPSDQSDGPGELEQRQQAWQMVKHGNRVPLARPPEPAPRRRGMGALALAGVLLVVVLLGWGLVTLAGQLSRVGGSHVRTELRP